MPIHEYERRRADAQSGSDRDRRRGERRRREGIGGDPDGQRAASGEERGSETPRERTERRRQIAVQKRRRDFASTDEESDPRAGSRKVRHLDSTPRDHEQRTRLSREDTDRLPGTGIGQYQEHQVPSGRDGAAVSEYGSDETGHERRGGAGLRQRLTDAAGATDSTGSRQIDRAAARPPDSLSRGNHDDYVFAGEADLRSRRFGSRTGESTRRAPTDARPGRHRG